jgi:hypothetical protein
MEQRKDPILEGDTALNNDRDDVAVRLYASVCQCVNLLTHYWSDTEATINPFVISYQNIVNVYFRKQNYSQAVNTDQHLYQPLKSYYLANERTSNLISAFKCTKRCASIELTAIVKRLGVYNMLDETLNIDTFSRNSNLSFIFLRTLSNDGI